MSTKVNASNNVPLFMGKTASDLGIESSEFIGSLISITSDEGSFQGQVHSVGYISSPWVASSVTIYAKSERIIINNPLSDGIPLAQRTLTLLSSRVRDFQILQPRNTTGLWKNRTTWAPKSTRTQQTSMGTNSHAYNANNEIWMKSNPWHPGYSSRAGQGVTSNKTVRGFAPRPQGGQSINNSIHPVAGASGKQKRKKTKLKKPVPSQMTAGDMGQLGQDAKPKFTQRGVGVYTDSDDSSQNCDNEDRNDREKIQCTKAEMEKSRVVESRENTCRASAEQFQLDAAVFKKNEKTYKVDFGRRFGTKKPSSDVPFKFSTAIPSQMTAGVMGQLDKEFAAKRSRHRDAVYSESDSEDGRENHVNGDLNESSMEFIIGRAKKGKNIADIRKNIETKVPSESELYILKLKQRIAELEDKNRFLESNQAKVESKMGTDVPQQLSSSGTSSKASEDKDVEVANVLSTGTRGTQTRIRARDMRMMIALSYVYEGCSVLIMWDNAHNTYVVFW